jgi:ABC-type antimicrobial peptide transport system permease subunit
VAKDAVPYGARSPLSVFWSRFRCNRLAVAALAFLAAIHLVAVTADVLAPYDPAALDLLNPRHPARLHPDATREPAELICGFPG